MSTNKKVRLPKVEIHGRFGSLSQVVDWGLKQMNVPDTWSTFRLIDTMNNVAAVRKAMPFIMIIREG